MKRLLKKSAALKALASASLVAVLATAAGQAQAITTTFTSNDPDCTGDPILRIFSVTADQVIRCAAKGTGNISGTNDAINVLSPGWITLDKTDDTTTGALEGSLTGAPPLTNGTGGTFSIAASAYALYDRIIIAFKTGVGQLDPDWAAFELAEGTLTGTWSVTGSQALSHANLYGIQGKDLPEPGTLGLLGLALAGLGFMRRRIV